MIAFLKQILRLTRGHIVLVWDRHPIRKGQAVQNFVQTHKCLIVFEFPVAAPELNPAESIWTQIIEYIAGTVLHNKYELQAKVFAGISRIRVSKKRLFACLHGSKLDRID